MLNFEHISFAGLASVADEESLRRWVRYELRPAFHHQCCVLSAALPSEGGMHSKLIGVDFPLAALRSITSPGGGIDTPIVRRWLQQGTPLLFDASNPWDGICKIWLEKFIYFGMRNTAAHGYIDTVTGFSCYFSFLNVPDINADYIEPTLTKLQGPISIAIYNLFYQHDLKKNIEDIGLLTSREREVAWWAAKGKSNWEIAVILGMSERTAKVHVSNILSKLGLSSRSMLNVYFPRDK